MVQRKCHVSNAQNIQRKAYISVIKLNRTSRLPRATGSFPELLVENERPSSCAGFELHQDPCNTACSGSYSPNRKSSKSHRYLARPRSKQLSKKQRLFAAKIDITKNLRTSINIAELNNRRKIKITLTLFPVQ